MAFRWLGMSEDGNTVTLRKLKSEVTTAEYATSEWMQANADLIRTCIILDVETTGLSRSNDKVIELGLRCVKFNRTNGDVLFAEETYTGLQDPGQPLSEEIQGLTGLTDEMVRGQNIDWERVGRYLTEAQLVVAHNASFDRPFLDRYATPSQAKIWGCSLKQIDWGSKGFPSQKLEGLCIYHGVFIDAHRAMNDVHALTYLLSLKDPQTGCTYLNELVQNARRPLTKVAATYSPFESKDLLKGQGYYWDSAARCWMKSVYKDEVEREVSWLTTSVYNGNFRGTLQEIPVTDNFKHG